ncbi:MAG: cysteine--tRNA ligase [Deltaproteobacteria bacterium]|nr:cysteine--tRNA ligase [Deltaproteobacteria bacterium]MBW2075286.1 cysteine--tRNA ligase [Deltaproteobacteria bacterium]
MTNLKIYNTLNKKKETFEPIKPGKVGIYVCGPTVYDACHIGHARSVVVFDVIVRYFRAMGYEVTYVRNFTDVDDKIINRARELGISTQELSERYIREFYEDMDTLKVERATVEPRATDHIDEIIDVIDRLISRGYAYKAGGDVFYAVETFKGYGKLSGRRLAEMQAGARVKVDEKKRNPFDFVLWKAAKPGEPMWDSPWGKGRPGWHIECSAMSTHFLGRHFDIHGGGKDLIFPHHENEIAQSEGAFGEPFVNVWIHNGFVRINQEKMSKSLGNFLMIKDILKEYHPEAVRLFLLSNHYRSPVDFTDQAMAEAEAGLEKIYALLQRIHGTLGSSDFGGDEQGPGALWASFCQAMDDDFNTARGIGLVFETVRQLNRFMDDMGEKAGQEDQARLVLTRADLMRIGGVLGILTETPDQFFEQKKADRLKREGIDTALIERLIAERARARQEKDWATADRIRDELSAMNILIEDRAEGTSWKVK